MTSSTLLQTLLDAENMLELAIRALVFKQCTFKGGGQIVQSYFGLETFLKID